MNRTVLLAVTVTFFLSLLTLMISVTTRAPAGPACPKCGTARPRAAGCRPGSTVFSCQACQHADIGPETLSLSWADAIEKWSPRESME